MNSDYTPTLFNSKLQGLMHVLVIKDETFRTTIILEEQQYTLGRDPRNNIPLKSKKVSRIHGTILRRDDSQNKKFSYWLLDGDLVGNRSTNGIFINDKRCLVQELKDGDLITFGTEIEAEYYVISDLSRFEVLKSQDFDLTKGTGQQLSQSSSRTRAPGMDEDGNMPTIISNSDTLFISEPTVESFNDDLHGEGRSISPQTDELSKLASFPEWSPNPIVEIDWSGKITYLNPSALRKFPTLTLNEGNPEHPVLEGLIKGIEKNSNNANLFVREININNKIFEQYIHYLSEQQLIRSYIFDFTARKATEIQQKDDDQRYKTVLNQLKEGIFLVDAHTRRVLEANSAFANLLGYRLDDLHSLHLDDLLSFGVKELEQKVDFWLNNKNFPLEILSYRRKNNLFIDLESSYSTISYGDQKIISFTVRPVTRDFDNQTLIQDAGHGLFDLEIGRAHV